MTASKTAFVAGATGYTGRGVVDALLQRGVSAVAHVRPDSSRREHWVSTFESMGAVADTTPWDRDALVASLTSHAPDAVFACLGTTRKRAASEGLGAAEAYEKIDYGLTVMLLEAVKEAVPGARFVYISAGVVRGGTRNAYIDARWRAEEAIRGSGVPYTIARPGLITGPDREEHRPAERVAAVLAGGLLGVVGALGVTRFRDKLQPVTGAQLGAALVRAAFDPAAEGKVLGSLELR